MHQIGASKDRKRALYNLKCKEAKSYMKCMAHLCPSRTVPAFNDSTAPGQTVLEYTQIAKTEDIKESSGN